MRVKFFLHNDCKANKAALSSRQLIWSEVSSAIHIPPIGIPPPTLSLKHLIYNNIRLTPLNRGWKFIHIIGPPSKVLPNRVRHSQESIKITTIFRKSCTLAISILYKTQEPPKHQGEPQQDNQ